MKNVVRKLLPLAFIPFLSACAVSTIIVSNNTTSIMSVSNMSSSEIYFSCKSCKGEIVYQITVGETQSLSIKTDVKIDGGTVTFTVTTVAGDLIYEQGITDNSNFEIPLKDHGKHRVKINHDGFMGSYRLNWSKK